MTISAFLGDTRHFAKRRIPLGCKCWRAIHYMMRMNGTRNVGTKSVSVSHVLRTWKSLTGAPIGTVAISRPWIVLLNAVQSVSEGHVASPGTLRHEAGVVPRACIATETTRMKLERNTKMPIVDDAR